MIDLHGLLAIAGYPGLYKVVAQAKNGVVVENISDKKRMMAHAHYRMSSLEDISIYTTADDVPLSEVMQKIHDKEKAALLSQPKHLCRSNWNTWNLFFLNTIAKG
ncbi:MAG: DUF5606 domain-containing protein, partial [Bacteroidota bacterium]